MAARAGCGGCADRLRRLRGPVETAKPPGFAVPGGF
ncbi:hypothetical protein J2S42_000638 [Catenuloplanes indicus]|uniref:Uncharacterized protein n=1 Tax=Catenuloplanes indicus TaxID=137267 RepID=A0AAE3VUM1_9ACTN|nr:hypothetical protein [Catenuloplanes indicus]